MGELCEAEGRTIDDLTVSANVRAGREPGEVADEAKAYGEAGADMVCVLLPRPYAVTQLDDLAPVLGDLA